MADIQFQDIGNQKKIRSMEPHLLKKGSTTTRCNLCSIMLKAGDSNTKSDQSFEIWKAQNP